MLPGAWSGGRGRRGALAGASAVVLCVGGLLAACGGDGREGHVATGAVGDGPDRGRDRAEPPGGEVEFFLLDGRPSQSAAGKAPGGAAGASPGASGGKHGKDGGGGRTSDGSGSSPGGGTPYGSSPDSSNSLGSGGSGLGRERSGGTPPEGRGAGGKSPEGQAGSSTPKGPNDPGGPSTGGGGGGGGADGSGDGEGDRPGRPGSSPRPPTAPGTTRPPGPAAPAALKVGVPRRESTGKRWCEDVTLSFRNTGGSPVRSGNVTLGTHVIGGLGVDWGTVESTRKLPAPIGAGKTVRKTWPICIDWWRVPLGMHIETRDVDVHWK